MTNFCWPVVAAKRGALNFEFALGQSEVTVTLGGFSTVHGVLVARELPVSTWRSKVEDHLASDKECSRSFTLGRGWQSFLVMTLSLL